VYPQLNSRAVAWWPVHVYVEARLVADAPLLGTPAWCALTDDDPAKLSAVLDGGQHFALRLDAAQEAAAEASQAVSAAVDWRAVAQEWMQLQAFRAANPWARREAS
jgi:hypothetical protein